MNDANNAGTLAPCPFCKSRCVTATRDEHGWKIVECDDCGARGPCIDLEGDQYIDRWNALSTPNTPVEQREATTSKMEVVQQREAIGLALRRFHQNSCYPQASDGEIDIAIAAILAVRLDEAAIRKDEREKCDSYRNALLWAFDRLSVTGGLDVDTQRRTMREIGNVLTGRTSSAATYQPNDDDDSVKLTSAIRNGGKQP